MDEDKEKKFFKLTEGYQGDIVCGLAMVTAAGLYFSGFREKLFLWPLTVANVTESAIILVGALLAAYFLFLVGVTLYDLLLKRLSFVKYPILKGIIIAVLMGFMVFLLEVWWGR